MYNLSPQHLPSASKPVPNCGSKLKAVFVSFSLAVLLVYSWVSKTEAASSTSCKVVVEAPPAWGRAIVVCHSAGKDLTPFALYLPSDIPVFYYTREDGFAIHHIEPNRGNEAVPFLRFILDHYDNLPNITLFLHGDRSSWHVQHNDLFAIVRAFRWEDAPEYVSLNYNHYFAYGPQSMQREYNDLCSVWPTLFAAEFNATIPLCPPRI